jgi:hypothetical protein
LSPVVGAQIQHPHHLRLVVAGGGDDDRNVADGAQHGQHVGAVDIRQAEVQQDDIRLLLDGCAQRGHAGADGRHGVRLFAQRSGEGTPDRPVVLDKQHLSHYPSSSSRERSSRARSVPRAAGGPAMLTRATVPRLLQGY